MDDFLVNEIYKNSQRLRTRNSVEEKLLQEILYGHKGYSEKLHKTLKKLEKTRQIIEQEYFYMEKEMKDLGIHTPLIKNQDRLKFKEPLSALTTERKDSEQDQTDRDAEKLESAKEVEIKQDESEYEFIKPLIKRRSSLQTPKSNLNIDTKRKFSLDSSGFVLGKNVFNFVHLEEPQSERIDIQLNSSINEDSNCNSENRTPMVSKIDQYPNQSARTQYSVKSAMTNQTNFSNLSHLTSNSLRKSGLFAKSSSRLPKLKKEKDEEQKRRVSFGQAELNQLEIPTLLRHSNVALEKFKLDPHFYLPNGDLKRKFSLPKLDETIDAIKNCRYLRRNSEVNEYIDVKNIFKDIDPFSKNLDNSTYYNEDDM